ncbi:MAG: hypothetical protein ACLQBB_08245 [Solirubrobacteraceae bacterium]
MTETWAVGAEAEVDVVAGVLVVAAVDGVVADEPVLFDELPQPATASRPTNAGSTIHEPCRRRAFA